MRTERYRFTVWVGRKDHSVIDAVELYDHRTDPQENTNIAKADGNAELVKRLMEQWRQGWQGAQAAVEYGAAHGALAMSTPGDTSMANLAEVEAVMNGAGARAIR